MLLLPLPHCCSLRFAYPNYEVAIGMNEEYDPKMTLMSGIQIKKTAVLAKCSKYHNKIITIMCLLNFGYKQLLSRQTVTPNWVKVANFTPFHWR